MIVLDANVAIWLVLPGFAALDVSGAFARWRRERTRLLAPMLWLAECVTAIRTGVYYRAITQQEGERALEDLLGLEVELMPLTASLSRSAFEWSRRLGQSRAYDAFYVALAEERGVGLWTADRRLANAAGQTGAAWVRWIGEGLS